MSSSTLSTSTPYTMAIVKQKLAKMKDETVDTVECKIYPQIYKSGPFTLSFVPVPHSIAEANGLLIETTNERIFHTGDFKFDENPGVGYAFDEAAYKEIGAKDVTALVCDSTNIFEQNENQSEETLYEPIKGLIEACTIIGESN